MPLCDAEIFCVAFFLHFLAEIRKTQSNPAQFLVGEKKQNK